MLSRITRINPDGTAELTDPSGTMWPGQLVMHPGGMVRFIADPAPVPGDAIDVQVPRDAEAKTDGKTKPRPVGAR